MIERWLRVISSSDKGRLFDSIHKDWVKISRSISTIDKAVEEIFYLMVKIRAVGN